MVSPWHYYAEVDRVIDGDTIDLTIDTGFEGFRKERIRLIDVDTAEIHGVKHDTEEYEKGMEHKQFVKEWLDEKVIVRTWQNTGSFYRYLGDIYLIDEEGERKEPSLTETLIEEYGDDILYEG